MGMVYAYDKKVRRLLLAASVGFFLLAISMVFECLYPFNRSHIPVVAWTGPALALLLGVVSLVLFFLSPCIVPNKACRNLGIITLATSPLLLVFFIALCLFSPSSFNVDSMAWPYFVVLSIMPIQLGFLIAIIISIWKRIHSGNTGLLIFYTWLIVALIILLTLMISYGLALARYEAIVQASAGMQSGETVALESFLLPLIILILVNAGVCILAFLAIFVIAFIALIAGKENRLLGVRGTVKVTAAFANKYDLPFWSHAVTTTLLLVLAFASALQVDEAYYSLAFLYITLLFLRIPSFLWNKKIERSEEDSYSKFQQKHAIVIYHGILLLMFAIGTIFIGYAGMAKARNSESAFVIYAFFVPWAIIKMISGFSGLVKARKTGDPYLEARSFTDLLSAIITVNTTLFFLFNYFRGERTTASAAITFLLMALFVAFIGIGYTIYISLHLLVLGYFGIKGKRLKYYQQHAAKLGEEAVHDSLSSEEQEIKKSE